jgi:fructooligosaccharide transport system permease protein
MKKNKIIKTTFFYIFITLIAMMFLLPMAWMISSSFKIGQDIYGDIRSWRAFFPTPSSFTLKSYKELLSYYNIFRNMGNSMIYGTIAVVGGLIVNSLAGYALAKFKFPLKTALLILIISLMIVPIEATILPMYLVVNKLKLLNSLSGLLLPFMANVMNIFLFRQYFLSFPGELIEAAKIDGLGNIGIFFRIVVPVSLPIFATTGILTFLATWNDFLWPIMVLTNDKMMPIQVALNAVFSDQYHIFTNHIMAGLTLATIPVLLVYLFFQKYIIQGIAGSGTKE